MTCFPRFLAATICILLFAIDARLWAQSSGSSAATSGIATASIDWSTFRGPTSMGLSKASGLPTEWSGQKNVVWKTELSGAGASSPIVFGDRVYLTSYTGYFVPGEESGSLDQLKRHLLSIDLKSGRLLWDRTVVAKLPEEEKIRDHGYAANSVAVDAQRVYAFFGKTGVFAFDHSGEQLWKTDVGSKTHGWGTSASPVLYKDLVFINASVESESLFALNRDTGKVVWQADGIREAWNTPVIVKSETGREELVVATQGKVLAFSPSDGKLLWSCNTDIGWYMVPCVVAHEGVVYCLGGRSGTASLAVRAGGSGDVTKTQRLWTSVKGSNVSSPVYQNGYLYWAHESREIAYCLDAKTGEVVYEKRLNRAGQFYSSALLANGKLYYVSREGKTFVLAAKPEYEEVAINDLNDGSVFNASPAVAGDRLLIRSDRFLYCLGED
jgi:outer membrane protein assembly factor BamB